MAVALKLDPSERIFICGATGSGKTYLARHLLRQWQRAHWRIVIVDPKHFWLGRAPKWARSGPGTVEQPRLVTRFDPKLAVQCYQPAIPAWKDEQFDAFCDAILKTGHTIVYFDETDGVCTGNQMSPGFSRLWTQGRALDVAAWAGAQRPFRVLEVLKSQAEGWIVFTMRGRRNRDAAAEYTDSPAVATTMLPPYWFWLWHVGMPHAQLMRPIPASGGAPAAKGALHATA